MTELRAGARPDSAPGPSTATQDGCAPLAVTPLPEPAAERLSQAFAALGDPVRLRLLSLMLTAESGEICACDLVAPVGRAQPTVSHHLRVLREAGLVTSRRAGTNQWYSVVPGQLEGLREVLSRSG